MDDRVAQERRIASVEKNTADHARIITAYNGRFEDTERRVRELEAKDTARAIEEGRRAEREIQWKITLDEIKLSVAGIEGGQTWLLRTVLAAVVVAFVTFVIKGGLKI